MAVLAHFITGKEMLAAKAETVPYTAESTLIYSQLVRNIKFTPNVEMFDRKYAVGDFDNFDAVPGKRSAEISFTVDMQGSGTAGTDPKWGVFMPSCGFRAANGSFGVFYIKDANVNASPITIEFVLKGTGVNSPAGIKVKMRGCMGDVDFKFAKTGEPWQADFKYMGVIVSVTNLTAAQLPGATGWDTTLPPATTAAAVKLRTYLMQANSLSAKMNNKTELLPDLNAAEGYEGAYLIDSAPSASLDPYLAQSSDQMFWETHTGETGPLTGVFESWAGATGILGNFLYMRAANAQVKKTHDIGSREGTEMNSIELQFNRGITGAPMFMIGQGSYTGIPGF